MKKPNAIYLLGLFLTMGMNYHVDIRNAPAGDAIRLLAKMQDLNVIVPEKLIAKINANFPSIQLEDALSAVLDTNQLGALVEGNVVRISAKKIIEDKGQDLRTTTFSLKYAKADKMAPQIKQLLSARGTVMPDDRTNSITVRDTETDMSAVTKFINRIDQADRQVLIEARIIQAGKDYFKGLGVQWGTSVNGGKLSLNGVKSLGGNLPSGSSMISSAPVPGATSGVSLSLGPLDNFVLDAEITAAEQNGELSILSRPSIVTMNNQPATIHSGVKFFVKTASSLTISSGSSSGAASGGSGAAAGGAAGGSAGGSGGVQQIDSGITLVVTPQVTANNKISLAINVTESQPDFANTVDGIPSIIDNNASTTVLLENGETTVIGGLFQRVVSNEKKGVPFLSKIPIVGALFGSRTDKQSKKELFIFLKPTVIAEGDMPAIQATSDKRAKEITDQVESKQL